jgi:hypothetical protein
VARSAKPFAVPFPRCFRVAVIPAAPQRSRARKLTINTFDNNSAPKSIKELVKLYAKAVEQENIIDRLTR